MPQTVAADKPLKNMEAAPGFEPGITVLQGRMRRMSKLLRLLHLLV
jgi:hypothetical protein